MTHPVLVVKAGQVREVLAAVVEENLPVLHVELFQPSRGNRRRNPAQPSPSASRRSSPGLDGPVRVGPQPFGGAEAGLELIWNLSAGQPKASRTRRQVFTQWQVGIALQEVFLRHAVEGDEDDLRLEGELARSRFIDETTASM